jgi:hypothetical protein
LFREYLWAVRLQFDWNQDFGFGPAGILGQALWNMKRSYSPAAIILYLVFAGVLGLVLLWAAYRVRRDKLPQQMWIPVALVGTFLLNPRIKEYDVAAITIPMLLIAWRGFRHALKLGTRWSRYGESDSSAIAAPDPALPPRGGIRPDVPLMLAASGWAVAVNVIANGDTWKPEELAILLFLFTVGVWSLFHTAWETQSVAVGLNSATSESRELAAS